MSLCRWRIVKPFLKAQGNSNILSFSYTTEKTQPVRDINYINLKQVAVKILIMNIING